MYYIIHKYISPKLYPMPLPINIHTNTSLLYNKNSRMKTVSEEFAEKLSYKFSLYFYTKKTNINLKISSNLKSI